MKDNKCNNYDTLLSICEQGKIDQLGMTIGEASNLTKYASSIIPMYREFNITMLAKMFKRDVDELKPALLKLCDIKQIRIYTYDDCLQMLLANDTRDLVRLFQDKIVPSIGK